MLKHLLSCIGEYKKDTIIAPIFVILEVIMQVLIPFLIAYLIDFGVERGNIDLVIRLGGVLLLSALLSMLFGIISGTYAARAAAGFSRNLRRKVFYKVQDFSFYNIDKISASGLVTRSTTDITNIQNAYQMMLRVSFRAPIMLIFALVMAFNINPQLSLVYLAVLPFLAIGLYLIISNADPLFHKVFRIYDKLNNVVQENLRGIRVVKSYAREEYEKEKFNDVSETIYKLFSKAERIISLNAPLMQLSVYTSIILIGWLGANMIVEGVMTTGQLVSMVAYTTQILMGLMMLSMILVLISISRASAKRIVEVLDEEIDLNNSENPIKEVKSGDISFQNVSFSYYKSMDNLCLNNINLNIKEGETVGILGGTGSGKTSLIQLIPRLYDVTEGSLLVGGRDVREYDIKALRNKVSVVLQNNTLFSGTIKENLRWGNKEASDEELIRVCKLAQAHGFIQELPNGYDTHIEQGGSNVSGGQKQRLCIARALLKKPHILILDDSTSAVDTKTESYLRKAFLDEIPQTTKIIIAQRITSVMDADKIVVMDGGKIDAIGTHDELLENNQIYQEVYDTQLKGGTDNGVA
ncbi:ABC transporter ATP-binding protein [Natranaerobius thermophilus]|nr:ABC transporter ATP-binding protein [Natranaerobius thermophilus]